MFIGLQGDVQAWRAGYLVCSVLVTPHAFFAIVDLLSERVSRGFQRLVSTCARNSAVMRLNKSGSSRLTAWPVPATTVSRAG